MAALLVCLVFLVSMVPVLNAADQKTIVPSAFQNLKFSFRLLSYFFPLLSPFSDPPSDRGRAIEKVDTNQILNITSKSTDEVTLIYPKTKD
jgi:hypothetical protein